VAGAIAIAIAGAWARQRTERGHAQHSAMLFDVVLLHTPEGETHEGIAVARDVPFSTWEQDAAHRLGNGSRITSADTVPFCLWAAARHLDDFTEALWTTVKVGGDIDTNAAIVGGIVALSVGPAGVPGDWLRCREPLH
jgi:ADP-ribosylglycohydrolase